jgi:hypothetical protein
MPPPNAARTPTNVLPLTTRAPQYLILMALALLCLPLAQVSHVAAMTGMSGGTVHVKVRPPMWTLLHCKFALNQLLREDRPPHSFSAWPVVAPAAADRRAATQLQSMAAAAADRHRTTHTACFIQQLLEKIS